MRGLGDELGEDDGLGAFVDLAGCENGALARHGPGVAPGHGWTVECNDDGIKQGIWRPLLTRNRHMVEPGQASCFAIYGTLSRQLWSASEHSRKDIDFADVWRSRGANTIGNARPGIQNIVQSLQTIPNKGRPNAYPFGAGRLVRSDLSLWALRFVCRGRTMRAGFRGRTTQCPIVC